MIPTDRWLRDELNGVACHEAADDILEAAREVALTLILVAITLERPWQPVWSMRATMELYQTARTALSLRRREVLVENLCGRNVMLTRSTGWWTSRLLRTIRCRPYLLISHHLIRTVAIHLRRQWTEIGYLIVLVRRQLVGHRRFCLLILLGIQIRFTKVLGLTRFIPFRLTSISITALRLPIRVIQTGMGSAVLCRFQQTAIQTTTYMDIHQHLVRLRLTPLVLHRIHMTWEKFPLSMDILGRLFTRVITGREADTTKVKSVFPVFALHVNQNLVEYYFRSLLNHSTEAMT